MKRLSEVFILYNEFNVDIHKTNLLLITKNMILYERKLGIDGWIIWIKSVVQFVKPPKILIIRSKSCFI